MNFLKNKLNQKNIHILILSCVLSYFSLFAQQTFTVTTTADTGSGSLRDVINNASGTDTILFSGITYPDTIRLISGEINISSISIVIYGPGADSLSISGEDTSRIFSFGEGDAEVHGMSFNNGYVYGFQNGGAFDVSAGSLTLYDCIVSNNVAIGDSISPSFTGLGGAFYVNGGLNLTRTSVFNNRSIGGNGNDGYGGAIYQAFGSCTIINSTLSGNEVEGGPATVGNNVGIGGAIALQSGSLILTNSSIAYNTALDGAGGGIFNFPGGSISLVNTIIGENISTTDPDVAGIFTSLGHNLIFDGGLNTVWLGSDLIGVNPDLGILRNNGGTTPTHALLPGSPAIDVGDSTNAPPIDQRGFPRIQDGNGDDIAMIDIGSYEAVVPVKPTNLRATRGDRLVILDWQYANDSDIFQYNIYRDSSLVGNVPVGTISFTDSDTILVNGQPYIYNVTAFDTIGFESSFSLPASATPNGPPRWSIPQGLLTFDEDDSLTVDLDSLLFDDSDPDDSLSISISSGNFVIISLNQANHVARFSAPANVFGLDTIIFSAFDPEGLTTSDTSIVRVNPVNDFPVMNPIPDSTILTYTDFNYMVSVNDLEGDTLIYSDNTNLFDIDSSGLIVFRPTTADTGIYQIAISVADNDTTVRDTFLLDIQISVVNSPLSLIVTALDQALNFSWTNPANSFYSGTRIIIRKSSPVTHPDSGIVALDTLFASPGNVSATISNLDIADRYYFLIFNYFRENADVILSGFVTGLDSTLSPQVSVDLSPRNFSVLNGAIYDTSIVITNNGGGTLISKFNYNPNALQSLWFSLDSTSQSIAPLSSINIPMRFLVPEQILDTLLSISVTLETNQPGWQERTIEINVANVFDRFSPLVFIDSKPDSVVKQAAVKYEFTTNDTVDSQIGDFPEQLFVRYALYNTITNQFVRAADSLHTNEIIFYPLTDGVYELSLWIYDRSGNGTALNEVAYIDTFIISASRKILPDRKWLLSSIPRDQNFTFPTTASDSDFVIFRWNAREEEYNQILNRSVEPGLGYWIYSNKSASLDVNNITFQTNNDSVIVPIARGWNQIGMPMPFNVEMSKVRFMQENASITSAISIIQAVSDSLIAPAIYWYRVFGLQSGYEWGRFDTIFAEPWRGYWIYSNTNGNLIYAKEPSFRNLSVSPSGMISNQTDTWELNLSIDCENMIDSKNIIGTRMGANLEILEPPVLDQYVSLYFKSGKNKLTGLYKSPLKDFTDVKRIDVFIETSKINKSHLIKWNLPENNVYFYLVDNNSEKIIDLRETPEYAISPTQKTSSLVLYATYDADFKPSIIPVEFKLKQNYPNPFNPITTIEFGIPESGKNNITTLKIYNVLGQKIVILVNGKMQSGYHKITWSGMNKNRQQISSGLYFYSLSNGKTELFKKMIFIK